MRLPKPSFARANSFARALRSRKTTRDVSDRAIPPRVLSNVLFAACGVNRKRGPFGAAGSTAASASNSQEIGVYVLLADGAYAFDRGTHALRRVTREDLRQLAFTPHQPLVSPNAPVQLVYVVDIDKLTHTVGFDEPGLHDAEVQKAYYFVDTGIVAGNVYLFCASSDLACWFHNCDKAALANRLKLRKSQRALFSQTIGYPA